MKKERNSRKELLDLYFYLDYKFSQLDLQNNEELKNKFDKIKDKYDKKFSNRTYPSIINWSEYYGVFKLKNNQIGIDPIRYRKEIYISDEIFNCMKNRNTFYFHPKKNKYEDYLVNDLIDEIDRLINDFKKKYKPIIDKSIKDIDKMKSREVYPGDYYNLQCGISGLNAAEAWAKEENYRRKIELFNTKFELKNNFYAQYFHLMASKIEAATIRMYSKVNSKMKHFTRDQLYNNINSKRIDNRKLKSYKYHDELYCIWNFIKHNSLSTYDSLVSDYKEVLIDREYKPGDLAIYYVKLNEKLILDLLNGTRQYFIEWCEANCDEVYEEAQWNYTDFFIDKMYDEIELITNPLGLDWYDDLD